VILEKIEKYQIWTNNDKEILVTTFDCRLKGAAVPPSAVSTPKRACQASSAANETTATFNLTNKHHKSNIIYQKLIKNRHPDKSNPHLVISNNLHSR
jgi:hypothetical protein